MPNLFLAERVGNHERQEIVCRVGIVAMLQSAGVAAFLRAAEEAEEAREQQQDLFKVRRPSMLSFLVSVGIVQFSSSAPCNFTWSALSIASSRHSKVPKGNAQPVELPPCVRAELSSELQQALMQLAVKATGEELVDLVDAADQASLPHFVANPEQAANVSRAKRLVVLKRALICTCYVAGKVD